MLRNTVYTLYSIYHALCTTLIVDIRMKINRYQKLELPMLRWAFKFPDDMDFNGYYNF